MMAAVRTASGVETRSAASFDLRASAAGCDGRGGIGRQSPITLSRPDGFFQVASISRASTRAAAGRSDRAAVSARTAACSAPPSRKLAFKVLRT